MAYGDIKPADLNALDPREFFFSDRAAVALGELSRDGGCMVNLRTGQTLLARAGEDGDIRVTICTLLPEDVYGLQHDGYTEPAGWLSTPYGQALSSGYFVTGKEQTSDLVAEVSGDPDWRRATAVEVGMLCETMDVKRTPQLDQAIVEEAASRAANFVFDVDYYHALDTAAAPDMFEDALQEAIRSPQGALDFVASYDDDDLEGVAVGDRGPSAAYVRDIAVEGLEMAMKAQPRAEDGPTRKADPKHRAREAVKGAAARNADLAAGDAIRTHGKAEMR